MKVAIIGGGASALACAISLKIKKPGIDVTVYERNQRILKKLLATGNGRCNLTNEDSDVNSYRGDSKLFSSALTRYFPEKNILFFESLGLVMRAEDQGRVYPASSQAASVVSLLVDTAERLGVKAVTETRIKSVEKKNGSFVLNGKYSADRVVIACGGCAGKGFGTDGDSFCLFDSLGVKYRAPRPALTGIEIKDFTKSLKGIRNLCEVKLYGESRLLWRETGEIQFNDYGVSGIPVMQLSGLVGRQKDAEYSLKFDFMPKHSGDYTEKFINAQRETNPGRNAELMMTGLLPKALGSYLLGEAGIKKTAAVGDLTEAQVSRLVSQIKAKEYVGLAPRPFEFAQVTAGGVGTDEVDENTLELKRRKGIYVIGEALDVDGICGGHNLQFAWSTGRMAADSIAGE